MSIHPVALSGFATDSANYDASRPDHQPTAVARLLQELAIPKGGRVVEVGSGTGKLTSHLLERSDNWQIICVEPSEVSSPLALCKRDCRICGTCIRRDNLVLIFEPERHMNYPWKIPRWMQLSVHKYSTTKHQKGG